MANSYTYPRVNINTFAKLHRVVRAEENENTVLFVPFTSEYGPANEITKIYSYEEFRNTFGDVDYAKQGQTALNIANWLTNGGTVYAYRVLASLDGNPETERDNLEKYSDSDERITWTGYFVEDGENSIRFDAVPKHAGNGYKTVVVGITPRTIGSNPTFNLAIYIDNVKVESRQGISLSKLDNLGDASAYIESIKFYNGGVKANTAESLSAIFTKDGKMITSEIKSGRVTESTKTFITSIDFAVRYFFTKKAVEKLSDRLLAPIQLILDAGYSKETKEAMIEYATGASESKRDDIVVILDSKVAASTNSLFTGKTPESVVYQNAENEGLENDIILPYGTTESNPTIAIYDQAALISEVTYVGKDIWVTPTYFLASLIPHNDNLYGIQYPVAGLTRGVLSGVKALDKNLTPADKQDLFERRINYIERDSRGCYIMSQRMYAFRENDDFQFSALAFLNNVRVKNKMVQELGKLGREYLFEFNDATTLSNMSNVLNKYVNNWVQNRTLSFANVVVEPDEFSRETLNVQLNIQFTGTIEVINIDIVIE